MTAWIVPTARAVGWLPLAAVGALLVGTSAITAYADRWPAEFLGTAAGALAAGAVAGLWDRAAELLSALPTSAAVRRVQRLSLLVPVAVVTWLAYLAPGHAADQALGWPVAPLLALLMTGVAVSALKGGHGGVALGVAVPLAWSAAARVGGSMNEDLTEVLFAWQHHPWLVTTAATAALVWRGNR
jgi:hypothetical protein